MRHSAPCATKAMCTESDYPGHCLMKLSKDPDVVLKLLQHIKFNGATLWQGECFWPKIITLPELKVRR